MIPLNYADILVIFFLTLGPLKALGPFVRATRGGDDAFRAAVARRAVLIATIVCVAMALVGGLVLGNWHVGAPAIGIAGGLILFLQALALILGPSHQPPPTPQSEAESQPSVAVASARVAVPALVTAPGIAAIGAFVILHGTGWSGHVEIIGALLIIMILNLVGLHYALWLIKRIPGILQLTGWVLAVLQSALAVQIIIRSLRTLGALPVT